VHEGADDDYRMVVDEKSLDWRGREDSDLSDIVETFADLLEPLADGRRVVLMTPAYSVECWESVALAEISYTSDRRVPRDARLRLARMLDKCRAIEPENEDDLPQPIQLDGVWRESSWGMSHVLARSARGRAMSCLIVPVVSGPSGWTSVKRSVGQVDVEIHILTDPSRITEFWRGVFDREPIAEEDFFGIAQQAFPRLIFASALAFHRFKGTYAEVLPWVVRLFSAIDDHFAAALDRHRGDRNKVVSEFASYGLDISPESPVTHKNKKAWAQRLVSHGGVDYRCEWHGKRLWDRDRVHFSLPIAAYQGRVLIGVFTGHLAT
jgi:hypothetical protein